MVRTLSPASRQAAWALLLLLPLLLTFAVAARAQTEASSARTRTEPPLVTAAATAERVRFAVPGGVVQLRLEVYDEAGRKVFDTEQRGGSVLDWHLQGGAGERVADGQYLCVLTVKDLRGRLSQRLGLAAVGAEGPSVQPVETAAMSATQAAVVGPVESDAALVVVAAHEGGSEPAAVVAHDGRDAQVSRTGGALSFRIGNFLSGKDREQMRITEDGRVGVGTDKPEATLDVAGAVRVSEGVKFADGTTLDSSGGRLTVRDANGDTLPAPAAAGTGTQGRLAKWAETGGAGTLGDSSVFEAGGQVGIGTTAPEGTLHIQTPDTTVFKVTTSGSVNTGRAVFQMYRGAAAVANGWDFGYNTDLASEGFIIRELTNGTSATRLAINKGTGNFGIGTVSPQVKLDVNGLGRFTPGGSGGAIQFGTPNTETGMTIGGGAAARADLRFNGQSLKLVASAPGFVPPSTNGVAISTAGRVGVGFDPAANPITDPSKGRLHVRGEPSAPAIYGESANRGVWGVSTGSSYGVYGESVNGIGMQGVSTNNVGTTGASTSHVGVYGSTASGSIESPGVLGSSTGAGGVGVRGNGTTGVYGVSQANSGVGVSGGASGSGGKGVYGASSGSNGAGVQGDANAGGGKGVYGTSTNATGYGVYAQNPTGMALGVEGNAAQSLSKGGLVKAMIYVNANGTVARCYNSQMQDGGASLPPSGNTGCGFTVAQILADNDEGRAATVTFNFLVTDRFWSATVIESLENVGVLANTWLSNSQLRVEIYLTDERNGTHVFRDFILIVY